MGPAPNPGIFIGVIYTGIRIQAAKTARNHVTVIAVPGCTVIKILT
jgi:hypothetical protein